jgi:hypothetical protein
MNGLDPKDPFFHAKDIFIHGDFHHHDNAIGTGESSHNGESSRRKPQGQHDGHSESPPKDSEPHVTVSFKKKEGDRNFNTRINIGTAHFYKAEVCLNSFLFPFLKMK